MTAGCMSYRNATRSLKAKLNGPYEAAFRSHYQCLSSGPASSRNIPILHIPSASIFRFSASNTSKPVFNLDWTIHEGDSWAIVGNAGEEKLTLLEVFVDMPQLYPVC